jgi:ribonuclease HI
VTRMKTVDLYTDGACKGNPGPGGYGAVLLYGKHRKELSGGFRRTTNNRMELTALIKALLTLKEPCRVRIFSDSKYLLDALRGEWILKWKRNGWRTATRQPVRNRDLWQELDRLLTSHEPDYRWVKGHALTAENNRCDSLAVAAANSEHLLVDEAYEAYEVYEAQNQLPGFEHGGPNRDPGGEDFRLAS